MHALVFRDVGTAVVSQIERPSPASGQILVRTQSCGLCHTDMDILHGRYGDRRYPLVPGHEFAGIVDEIGSGVTGVAVGDRVVIDPNIPCGKCESCRRGLVNICENLQAYGVTTNGGFAEFSVVNERNVHLIGDMPFDIAALAEPLGCVLNGLNVAGTDGIEEAIVFGAGPIGLLMSLALKARRLSKVYVVDIVEQRLAFSQSLGLHPIAAGSDDLTRLAKSLDLAVDATGVPRVAASLTTSLRNGGTALFFGVCPPDQTIAVSPFEILVRQLKLVGAPSLNRNIPDALEVLKTAGMEMRKIVSNQVPLSEIESFLSRVGGPDVMKVQYAA